MRNTFLDGVVWPGLAVLVGVVVGSAIALGLTAAFHLGFWGNALVTTIDFPCVAVALFVCYRQIDKRGQA